MKLKLDAYKRGYEQDGRTSINYLYQSFLKLGNDKNWNLETIDTHQIINKNEKLDFPVLCLRTKKQGKAIWIISGIHGEEPAGPIAISKNLIFFKNMQKKNIPIILLPLCNPSGYYRNWRHTKHPRYWRLGKSVQDAEHLLLKKSNKPRMRKPTSEYAKIFTEFVVGLAKRYPPLLVLDLHEDNLSKFVKNVNTTPKTYIYSQGKSGTKDKIAKEILKILVKNKVPILNSGTTFYHEKIINGVVSNVKDSSIDELLASNKIYYKEKIINGPACKSVIVVETLTRAPLKERINTHEEILRNLPNFLKLI